MCTKHFCLLAVCLGLPGVVWGTVEESTFTINVPETDQTTSTQESEAKGIIPPRSIILKSTEPLTPTSLFPIKKPYDQAREELIQALDLWNAGHAEAASDKALEAYDDLLMLRRVPGVKRSTLRAQAHQAAAVYVEAGIAYIRGYVKKLGETSEAVEEGIARLGDLRDVARNYPELNRMLNNAINQLSGSPSTPQTKK
ncbi:MAG: hypothetical protein A2992_06575 [Elusimicrobia bacterium RIFCSPLOWO2_01_FULL_59_12]|nr:MAG: hypothetical protein A2992_06575 [Elusimicrobia bacterium RIFCSPLOWO2_01_FULL_59_12]